MRPPELPKNGGSVLATVLAWMRFSKASRIVSVIGGQLKESPNGATLVIDRQPNQSSARIPIGKLLITRGSEAGKYRITPGFVNGETPTLGGVAINAATPPEFTVTASTYFWIKCVGTFGSPDSFVVTIHTQTAATEPAGTAITGTGFTSFRFIGLVSFTAGSPATYYINPQHGGGNLGVVSFGLYNLWWRA